MKFLIKVNLSKDNSMAVTKNVMGLLAEENHEYMFCAEHDISTLGVPCSMVTAVEEGAQWCDVIITIGGDGTLLSIGKTA
ncbi:MAG: hypothetical protein II977_06855, partial [Oscillospiraceae bacterium]|nr:hypothetical protein [Oscillospiraceae bacterium]